MEICSHEYVDTNTSICGNCGLLVESESMMAKDDFSKLHNRVYSETQSAMSKTLHKMNLPDSIIAWVEEKIAMSPKSVFKLSSQNKIIFAHVYLAYLVQGILFDPYLLIEAVGIDKADINESLKIVSGISSRENFNCQTQGLVASIVVMKPEDKILSSLFEQLNLDNKDLNPVKLIIQQAMKLDKFLEDEDPRLLALGAIRYYFENQKIKSTKLGDVIGVGSSVTKKYSNKIKKILG
jgi:hypothetical protein